MNMLRPQADGRLQDMLGYACQEIEYYRTFFSTSETPKTNLVLSDFPLLTRQAVQQQHGSFLNSKYQSYPNIEYLLLKRSFGRSGVPLEVYWDSRDNVRSESCLWAYREDRFGITADEKCCVFRTAEYAGNKVMDNVPRRFSRDGKILSFSMRDLSSERLQACIDAIIAFEPIWMILPPSVALMLAENMTADRQSPPASLRYIELRGEACDMQTEDIIREAFCVRTAYVYATQATGAVAISCPQGHLHIFSENAAVEIIRNGKPVIGGEGDVCISSLQNRAMPLIRLKTGDRGMLQNISCSCGLSSPILRLTRARDCSFLTARSGRKISANLLRSLAEYTNEEVSRCLAHIQFRQTGSGSIDAFLGVKPAFSGWEEETARIFLEKIQDTELGQMQWNFVFANPCSCGNPEVEEQPFFELLEGGSNGS